MQKLGLGVLLKLTGKGYIDEMGKVRDSTHKFRNTIDLLPPGLRRVAIAAQQLQASIGGMGKGIDRIGSGFRDLGIAAVPLTAGVGMAVKSAADFEHQMKAVEAVTSFTADQYKNLGGLAKQIGIETQYDPSEAAQLLEGMGRAGAKYNEIMEGARGVANAAAAEQMELADAQRIVSQSARIMGMELTEASTIADSYAMLSANANTNIMQLGEAFKFAGPSAKKVGMDLHQLNGFLAALGDAGLRGSIGGTALQNMLNKLTKGGEKANRFLKKNKIRLTETNGQWRPLTKILADVSKGLAGYRDQAKRARMITELFGIRGERAFLAFETRGQAAFENLIDMSRDASKAEDEFGKRVGAATLMANKRLEGFTGLLILFKGSIKTFAIEAAEELNKVFGKSAKQALDWFNNILRAFSEFNDTIGEKDGIFRLQAKYGKSTIDLVMGIKDGLKAVKNAISSIIVGIKNFAKSLSSTLGPDGTRKVAKMAVVIAFIGAALGPIMLALLPIKMAFSGIWKILTGIKTILVAVAAGMWPLLVIAGLIGGAFLLFRKEGEGAKDTLVRAFTTLTTSIETFKTDVVDPFIEGFSAAWDAMGSGLVSTFDKVSEDLKGVFSEIGGDFEFLTSDMQTDWQETGRIWAAIGGAIVDVLAFIMRVAIKFYKVFSMGGRTLVQTIGNIYKAFQTLFSGEIIKGFGRLALAFVDAVAWVFRMIAKGMLEFADLIGQGDKIPKGLKTWVEKGFTGLVFGEGGTADKKMGAVQKKISPPKMAEDPRLTKEKQYLYMEGIMNRKEEAILNGFKKAQDDAKTPVVKADLKSKLCVDGEGVNVASSRHKTEVKERMGWKSNPYQQNVIKDHGVEPA